MNPPNPMDAVNDTSLAARVAKSTGEQRFATLEARRPSPCTRVQVLGRVVRLLAGVTLLGLLLGCGSLPTSQSSATTAASIISPPTSPAMRVDADDPTWGAPAAPVTIVVFLDLECPYCARGYATLEELREDYGPDVLRVVYKHAPLPFHERGMPAAIVAQAVYTEAGSDAFHEYLAAIFSDPDRLAPGPLQDTGVQVGVPPERLAALLGDADVMAAIDADLDLAQTVGVDGVPAFFINGARLVGARPIEEFRALIEHERRAAEVLMVNGVSADQVYAARVDVNLRAPRDVDAEDDRMAFVVPVGDSPAVGPEDAWVTIVEFADFECPYCRTVHPIIRQLIEQHPGKVRWVMKHNPLDFHQLAVPAALLALEVRTQRGDDAYWQALERLFAAPRITQPLLVELAGRYQLDATSYGQTLALGAAHPKLQADSDLAMDLQAQGTPHFFVNGRRVVGAQPADHFRAILEQEFTEVERLLAANPGKQPYQLVQSSALPPPGLVKLAIDPPDASTPSLGPEEAPVVVQMFSDFECGYCRRVMPTLDELRQRYPGQIRVVWRHLPLSFHRHAMVAAHAAMEVRAQRGEEAFWQMTERLLGVGGHEPERLTRETLTRHAHELGVEPEAFTRALDAQVHQSPIDRDLQLAARLGITGTPTFVIDGYELVGAQPLSRFERLVRLALSEKGGSGDAKVDVGTPARNL